MQLYPEEPAVLNVIKSRGLKWGVAPNLATPYVEPLFKLFPFAPDISAWSFPVGDRKPKEDIYEYTCKALGVSPASVLMVETPWRMTKIRQRDLECGRLF